MTYLSFSQRAFVYGACTALGSLIHPGAVPMRGEQGHIDYRTRHSIDMLQALVHRNLHQSRDAWTHKKELRPSMETCSGPGVPTEDFQLRFQSLFSGGKAFVIPCNAGGHVVMDALSERARNSYLFARATVGRLYAPPKVIAAPLSELVTA